jgi:NAD-dependent SIR2 family protein deacetylase
LTDNFDIALSEDRDKVDLLLVIGTSLNVAPVSDVVCLYLPRLFLCGTTDYLSRIAHLPHSVPQVRKMIFSRVTTLDQSYDTRS